MLIRCEKCSTLYELDEALLPPQGAPVQCSRCQYVFTARPERQPPQPVPPAAGDEQAGAPSVEGPVVPDRPAAGAPGPAAARAGDAAAPEASASATPPPPSSFETAPPAASTPSPTPPEAAVASGVPAAPSSPAPASGVPASGPASAGAPAEEAAPAAAAAAPAGPEAAPAAGAPGADEPKFTADGRPIRKVPFPEEDLTPSAPRTPRAPSGISGGVRVGSRRGVPVVPIAVAVLLVAAALLAWRLLGRRADPSAASRAAEGQQLLLRDDRASLTRAIVAFDDAARADDRQVDARADRVLARALLLGLVQGEAARVDAMLAAREAERARSSAPVGPPVPGLSEQIEALRAQREAVRARLRELEAIAASELTPLQSHAGRPAVQRARAVLDAYATDPARAAEAVLRDRPTRGKDPWIDLAVGAGETRAVSPELRAEGVARLEALVKAHPEVLRARMALAEALARAGRVKASVATLDALLAANHDHDDARALRSELTSRVAQGGGAAPVSGAPVAIPVAPEGPADEPPPGSAAPQPRNESSQAQP